MITPKVNDRSIEQMVSVLLRTGVTIAGTVVLGGGIFYLIRHGYDRVDYHAFHTQPSVDRLVARIVKGALTLRGRSIIQLGVLLLIATPIARVAFSLVRFALERDRTYVLVTAIVLTVLLFSFVNGVIGG